MTKTIHGRVQGRTIQLDEDIDLPDGEEVEVVVTATKANASWGEGIRRSAGAAADVPGFDEVFEQIERERKTAPFRDSEA
jgi:hypothetical protein